MSVFRDASASNSICVFEKIKLKVQGKANLKFINVTVNTSDDNIGVEIHYAVHNWRIFMDVAKLAIKMKCTAFPINRTFSEKM